MSLEGAKEAWGRLWEKGKQKDKSKKKKNNRRTSKETSKQYIKRIYQQHSIQGANLDKNDAEVFGDTMQKKLHNVLRVGLHNISNLPRDPKVSKSRQLIAYIGDKGFDAFLMTEVGLCWRKLDPHEQWFERLFGRFRSSRSIFACNLNELAMTKSLQPGGVGVVVTDEVSHRTIDQGKDTTGMGRWAWILLQGQNGIKLRIVSVYRPCDSDGPETVNQQQQRYLLRSSRSDTPRDAIYQDLATECQNWITNGNQLIVGLDANEDVRTGNTKELFRMLGMREAILTRNKNLSPPATHNRNQQRQPIDGIFVTPGLKAIAAGYEPFGTGCPSDHRILWVDFTYEDAFGSTSPPLTYSATRRLNTKDPRLVVSYNKQVKEQLVAQGLAQRLFQIERQAKNEGWSAEAEMAYNQINSKQLAIRKEVELNIRKLRTGGIPWSPKLQGFRNDIELWAMILRKRKGVKVSTKRIRRFMVKTGRNDALSKHAGQAASSLDLAHKAYKTAKKDAEVWRDNFMESLAQAKAERSGTNKDLELQQLMRIERQKRQARNIKRTRRKIIRNSTTKIFATIDGVRTECADKISMEAACMRENEQRFSQVEGTPPMIEPLLSDLGYLADTNQAEAILNGTYDIPFEVDMYTAKLLRELRTPDSIARAPLVKDFVTTEGHRAGWKRQKESTSAEPNSLTFSHYKAGADDDIIGQFDAALRSMPYHYGFAPDAFRDMTDVEILKKSGVLDVEKMRTILLMDPGFNMNNKQLGRDMMKNAESHNALSREQYGSRKHHQAITAALNKRLTMDLLRQRRQAGAICSNDAKSCYDRVVHSIASLAFRRLGVPINPIKSMFLSIQQASHKIRTAFGVSTASYGKDRVPPLQGMGQGNGAGPAGWAAVSTPIIEMMRTASYGFHVLSAISLDLVEFVCYAFVDDSDVVHTASDVDQPGEEVMEEMQGVVDHWEGGLRATGGALVPSKVIGILLILCGRAPNGGMHPKRIVQEISRS